MRITSSRFTAAALTLLAFAGCQSTSTNPQASTDPWWKFGYGSKNSASSTASNAPLAPSNPTLPSATVSPGTPMNGNAGPGTSGTFTGSPYMPPASSPGAAYPGTGTPGSIYGAGGTVRPAAAMVRTHSPRRQPAPPLRLLTNRRLTPAARWISANCISRNGQRVCHWRKYLRRGGRRLSDHEWLCCSPSAPQQARPLQARVQRRKSATTDRTTIKRLRPRMRIPEPRAMAAQPRMATQPSSRPATATQAMALEPRQAQATALRPQLATVLTTVIPRLARTGMALSRRAIGWRAARARQRPVRHTALARLRHPQAQATGKPTPAAALGRLRMAARPAV